MADVGGQMSEGRGQKPDSREHGAEEFGIGFLKTYGIKLRFAATSLRDVQR